MTEKQRKDIFIQWSLYGSDKKNKIVNDYLSLCCGYYSQEGFLNYLKDRLELESLWLRVDLG